ncbi:hypothetical protein RJ640_002842 [Escallonia rubra]|uniref:NADP-dependent oxidoreductase domain-containing protein n=1 Tax=Escallonia rubra TaxID=112253 RepID=A0AA88RJ77_9ASTE|nr:hypothetical protein RJ640_002842 [Escallonia rubra]
MASAKAVPRRKLGSQCLDVSAVGLGCMGMSWSLGHPKPEPEMIKLIHHAVDSGVTFFDTSDVYGPHTNEILIGKALKGVMREKVQVATKFGARVENGKPVVQGDPAYVRACCEGSLKRLEIDCIDLYYVHRIDTTVPIEVTESKGRNKGTQHKLMSGDPAALLGEYNVNGISEEGSAPKETGLAGPGRLTVSALGLGCMGMSWAIGHPKSEPEMIKLLHSGVTFFDTSDVYGPHTNEILIGKALKGVTREKVSVATKFGTRVEDGKPVVQGDPAYVRACCEASLKLLEIDCIDLYYVHRIDTTVPIEVTVGEMKKLVEEGKIKYIGLSEASPDTIRRAHAVHPITAVQLEWSLWTRDSEEEVIPTCRELGIGIVPYSPLGQGFFAVSPKVAESVTTENDYRSYGVLTFLICRCLLLWWCEIGERPNVFIPKHWFFMLKIVLFFFQHVPKFQGENFERNKTAYERVKEMAEKKGCTPSQLALAWVLHQGNDVVPIPGTTKIENFNENVGAVSVSLTPQEMAELETIASLIKGDRYPEAHMKLSWKYANTPPLSSWKSS